MWFDEIMDDCKRAMRLADNNKGIFAPIFIKLGLYILLGAIIFISVLRHLSISNYTTEFKGKFFQNNAAPSGFRYYVILGLIVYILYIAIASILEVGTINLIKTASYGIKLNAGHFIKGIKDYFLKVAAGKILINLVMLILSPAIIILLTLYSFTIGILTAGWGVILIGVIYGIFLGTWTTAVVADDLNPLKAIKRSIVLGKRFFWPFFIVILASALIGSYIAGAFGAIVAIAAGWFLSGVVLTYFKIVIYFIYLRKKQEIS